VPLLALTREISPAMAACELTHQPRVAIDIGLARAQHEAYRAALAAAGCRVVCLPADPTLPDCVFVEDIAVVTDDVALVTRPGAASRRRERAAVGAALAPYRPVIEMSAPATLDGGDVLRIGRTVFVGRSSRTNEAGIDQLRAALAPGGYTTTAVDVHGGLHLKSAATQVAEDTVLVNPHWVDAAVFRLPRVIAIDPAEPCAANGLLLGRALVYPASFPGTRHRLEEAGVDVVALDASEVQKAEGAVTCCSIILRAVRIEV
jgi:dimethylargininase